MSQTWKRYECPSCEEQFAFQGTPRFCPLCSYDTQQETLSEVISSPGLLRKGAAKNVDGIYRAEEEASKARAEMAMNLGATQEDANNIKLTNQRDNLREGDTAYVPVDNPVSRAMEAQPNFGFSQGANGLGYSQMAHSTAKPTERNAGARAASSLKAFHQAQGHVTSDAPALETQQPGYRRRV